MKEREYKARDKVVQKMTRDGLAERNLAEGTEQGISQRPADYSFRQAGPGESGKGAGRQRENNAGRGSRRESPRPAGRTGDDGILSDSQEYGERGSAQAAVGETPDFPAQKMGAEPDSGDAAQRSHTRQNVQQGNVRAHMQREEGFLDVSGDREIYTDTMPPDASGHAGDGTRQFYTGDMRGGQTHNRNNRLQFRRAEKRLEEDSIQGKVNAGEADGEPEPYMLDAEAEVHQTEIGDGKQYENRKYSQRKRNQESTRRRTPEEAEKHPAAAGRKPEGAVAGRRVSYGPEPLATERQADAACRKPSLLKQTGGGLVHTVQSAASSKVRQKVRETEQDSVGVESAHKTEAAVERAGSRAYRISRERLRTKPYRAMKRMEKQAISAEGNAAYRKLLAEKPEQKKTLAKWVQKQKIKRKYAAAARNAAKEAGHAAGTFVSTGKVANRITQYFRKGRPILVVAVGAILLLAVFGSLFSSCSSLFMGMGSAVASACYLAGEMEISRSELYYTELETDLQLDIANTERDYPGYDEYRYNIGEIGHNPYELMGYLSAVFDDFTYSQVEAELDRLFSLQYWLIRETVTETRTYLDEEGEEQEYEWRILKTVLSVSPLSGILSASLGAGDSAERYGIYMQTCGGRQQFGSPFGFPWLGYVTSPYGYRVHPLNGGKDLHRGVDIAVAAGTPILAGQDGRVISAGDAGGYGLCLVIEGESGYQSRYAHCSSLAVRAGQEVRQGEVVAYVGNTGDSTGPHLHLEVTHDGEYLDPYFFVDNGGGGYTAAGNAAGSPQFPADSGEPMGDGTFSAMLEVAERYMGYPYVWGGSSPSTSFDCSGYVSYVINQSGAGSVGRQTAQGLCNLCTPVSWEDLQPGDLVFFTGTYSSPTPVSHVGIYVGGGRMAHAGDPIGYADIGGSRYWKSHFYCGGRLP